MRKISLGNLLLNRLLFLFVNFKVLSSGDIVDFASPMHFLQNDETFLSNRELSSLLVTVLHSVNADV